MKDILRFPFVKTLSTVVYDRAFGLTGYPQPNSIDQDFIFKIRYGNLLKDSGDILLCPLSEGFKPSNPLSRNIIKKEGKWLDKEIKNLYPSDNAKWIGSEHVAFLPCRKLKYRGILFVSVDFYSEKREEINAGRITEALEVATRYNCKKLSCPQNLLYNPEEKYGYDYIHFQFESIILALGSKIKIDFVIETVIRKNLKSFPEYVSTSIYYDFSNSLVDYLPRSALILPYYRIALKSVRTAYSFSTHTQKQILALLTKPINEKGAFRLFKKLYKIMGGYDESGVGRYNDGFGFFLLGLCKEMPWNFFRILEFLKRFTDLYKGKIFDEFELPFDDFIFNERFSDMRMFEYREK